MRKGGAKNFLREAKARGGFPDTKTKRDGRGQGAGVTGTGRTCGSGKGGLSPDFLDGRR